MKNLSIFAIFAIAAGMCFSCSEQEKEKGRMPSRKASGCKSCSCLESSSVSIKKAV
jgi:hypothetical protein